MLLWSAPLFAEEIPSKKTEKKQTLFGEGIEEILSAPFGVVVSLGNILVTPSRLPGKTESLYLYPSQVTVITQKEIQESQAKTIPELLRHTEGIYLYDSVGNDQDLTVSLRGFNEGEDMLILVDGIRVNETDANNMIFPLIPLDTVERIEIFRGSSSAIYGDGVFSGVMNIITKRAPVDKEVFYEAGVDYGSYQSQRYKQFVGGKAGPTDWSFAYIRDLTDGYRSNGGLRGTFIDAKWGFHAPDEKFGWRFLVKNTDESMQNPGALTASEMNADRRQSRNPLDGREMFMTTLSTDMNWQLEDLLTFRSNLFYREESLDFITTSRTFPTLAGTDELITDTFIRGVVAEFDYDQEIFHTTHHLVVGGEFTSSLQDDERYDTTNGVKSALTTSRVTDKYTTGVFGQYDFDVTEWCRLSSGVRFDDVSFNFVDELDAAANRKNHFSEVSPKTGIVFKPWETASLFGNFSHSFKSPNTSDLFAFPGVGGSDPNLGPEKGESFEGGIRFSLWDRLTGSLSYFRINLHDEIRFDGTATSTTFPFGKFSNVAKTRRNGVELSLKGRLLDSESYFTYAFTNAALRSGDNSGKKLTMVPEHQFTWGSSYTWRKLLRVGYDAFYVGDQFVVGDDNNTKSPLENYLVTNAQVVYTPKDDMEIFFRVNNLFDTLYSTRAVTIGFSETFATGTVFYNPAPERNATVGVKVRF